MKKTAPIKCVPQSQSKRREGGQALIEYSLILVLAFIGLVAILTILAPAVGNVFSNTVYNLLGQTTTPQEPLDPTEFWDIVTAVASYTPSSPDLQTNTAIPPTPLPTSTWTAGPPTETFTPSLTYTPSDTPTITPSVTFGPSPTPADTDYGYPFGDDGSNGDTFQDEFADEFWENGPWTAEYWHIDWTDSSGNGCNWGNFFNGSTGDISRSPAATISVPRIKFPEPGNADDFWRDAFDKAHPDLWGNDFCARYSTSIALEATTYTLNYRKDDGVRIYVSTDGSSWNRIVDRWNYDYNEDVNGGSVNYTPPSAGTYFFRVIFRDTGGAGHLTVSLNQSDENSSPSCDWQQDNGQGNTAPPSWHESLGRYYYRNQECVLRLRGTIDLTGAVEPYLEFYDRYNINSFDNAYVSVAVAGTENWKTVTVHNGPETNWAFSQQRFDLARFVDDLGTITDFTNQQIELRFIFESDNSNEGDGWWIDDISVREIPENVYYLGFQDPVDTSDFWIPDGYWAVSNVEAHNGTAWDDSPGFNYSSNSNTSIRLNGRLDLSASSPVTVTAPQVVFWQWVDIDPVDRIYVEISTDKVNWSPLATQSVFGYMPAGHMAQGNVQIDNWTQATADIPAIYIGESRVYIRFRLETDGSGNDRGWIIDDIQFRNKPTSTLSAGECDTFDGGTANWVLNGQWGTSTNMRDGAYSLADSPIGNYSSNTNYSAELISYLDVDTMTRPVVTFYHQWDIKEGGTSRDSIVAEVSPDDGVNWYPVFTFTDNDNTVDGYSQLDPYPNWSTTIPQANQSMDEVMTWQREVLDLTSYIGTISPGVPGLKFRFRLYSDGSTEEDGWYIDTFCFNDAVEPLITLPFADDMEAGTFNWYVGGKWDATNEEARSGSLAWSDTPYANTRYDETHILELRPTINLAGAVQPALYYWTKYNIPSERYWEVEIAQATATGGLLSDWTLVSASQVTNRRNDGWHRVEVDLTPYIGQNIRIRWHSQNLNGGTTDRYGTYLDDVQIISRTEEATYTTPYNEDVEALNPGEFVYEHEWAPATEYRSFGSGPSLGPGQWDVDWYDVARGCYGSSYIDFDPTTSYVGSSTMDEVYWADNSGVPQAAGISSDDYRFGAVFTRDFYIPAATTYQFSGIVDDGVRVWVYPTGTLPDMGNPNYEWRWYNCGVSENFTSPPINFPAGTVTVMIHYLHNGGSSNFTFNFEGESQVFTDSPSGNYDRYTESVVELEGLVTIPAASNYTLQWDQRYNLGSNHRVRVDISTDGGFTWTNAYSQGGTTNLDWLTQTLDLTSYAGNNIAIRFRLDALSNDSEQEGWWVDNIRIIE